MVGFLRFFCAAVASVLALSACGAPRSQPQSEAVEKGEWRQRFGIADLDMEVSDEGVFYLPSPEVRNSVLVFGPNREPRRLVLPQNDAEVFKVRASADGSVLAFQFNTPESVRPDGVFEDPNICIVDLRSGKSTSIPRKGSLLSLAAISPDGRKVAYFSREPMAIFARRLNILDLVEGDSRPLTDPFDWPGSATFLSGDNIAFSAHTPKKIRNVLGRRVWSSDAEPTSTPQLFRTHTFIQSISSPIPTSALTEVTVETKIRRPLFEGPSSDGGLMFLDYDSSEGLRYLAVSKTPDGHLIVRKPPGDRFGIPSISRNGAFVVVPTLTEDAAFYLRLREAETSVTVWSPGRLSEIQAPEVTPDSVTLVDCRGA